MFNVTRTDPAPSSLAQRKSYTEEDVLTELQSIFFNKCYLCEIKDPITLNVEHFEPHEGDDNKKYDWNNLYYVCGRCNNLKLAKYKNILDCTDSNCDVCRLIKHLPPRTPYGKVVIQEQEQTDTVLETVQLLDEIFNTEKTINKKITGAYLRKKIFSKYNKFLKQVNVYIDDGSSKKQKRKALEKLEVFMGPEQEFSAFLRWLVLEDNFLKANLGKFIN